MRGPIGPGGPMGGPGSRGPQGIQGVPGEYVSIVPSRYLFIKICSVNLWYFNSKKMSTHYGSIVLITLIEWTGPCTCVGEKVSVVCSLVAEVDWNIF